MQSFADSDTHFQLEIAETSDGWDGIRSGEPTGYVICDECGGRAKTVEEIPHEADCPQRGVVSKWWVAQFIGDTVDV
ncbi:hypothetical protein [Halobellus rubicundus]|uniref:Uncharacterized protein n=1 Tax=Halobellus rubicundus TaxID=2996466 RepID=A0ABD5MDU6_9EURY